MSVNPKIRVYIASPYSIGDPCANVRRSMDCFDSLLGRGYAPYAPLLTHFQNIVHHRPYQDWINFDLQWVLACDVVLRLPGESKGADGEVLFAQQCGIPVVYSIEDLGRLKTRHAIPSGLDSRWLIDELVGIQRIAIAIEQGIEPGHIDTTDPAREIAQRIGLLARQLKDAS